MTTPSGPIVGPLPVPDYSQSQLSAPQTSSATVANMIEQVLRQFGDEANVQITNADIMRWINMGLVEISRNNRIWEKTAVIYSTDPSNIDPSQFIVPLPNDCMMLQAVRYDGKIIPGFDFEQLISEAGSSIDAVGTPMCYYLWAGGIYLYPRPNVTGKNIFIYYRAAPPAVSSQADPIPIPDKYFDTLEAYVLAKAYELDEDWQAQGAKKQLFDAGLTTMSEESGAIAGDFYTVTDPMYEYPGGW
jgi:hypothetical protein